MKPIVAIALVVALLATACRPLTLTPAVQPLVSPTPARPQLLVLQWPAPGEAVDDSPLLQWESFTGASHYQVTVLDSGSAVVLQQDSPYAHLRVSPPLPKGARYAWQVQAQDANHIVLAELSSQFSVSDDLVLVWPADREAVDVTPVLQWQAFPGAIRYRVLIDTGPADVPQVVVDQLVTEAQFAVTSPLQPGAYRWTVQAQDADQVILAELNSQFSVKAWLELLEPADGAEVGASPTVRWNLFPGATQYQVVLMDPSAQPPAAVLDTATKGTQVVVYPPLKPEADYSLTVRALDDARNVLAESNTRFRVYAANAFYDCGSVRSIPQAECDALAALYQATGGSSWAGGSQWLTTDAPCEWPGVTCTDGHVTDLSVFFMGLRGGLPAVLANLAELQVLNLRDNQLSGPIPSELAQLAHLRSLDLSHNQLTGGLPVEFDQLHSLEFLLLQFNQFDGEVPAAWQHLKALRHLDLSHNALTGPIPAGLGQLAQLQALRLGYNQFSGSIPVEVGQLEHLTELDVSYNQLSGPVPEAVLRLQYRGLWGNQLEGTMRCEGDPSAAIQFQGISFACPTSLASSIWADVLPAIPAQEGAPFWEAQPERVRLTLTGAPGAAPHTPFGVNLSDQAQVLVFPGPDYRALDRTVRVLFGDLLDLLDARPATIDGNMPLLPLTNAGQILHAQVRYLDFAGGSGVRYLTQFSLGLAAINNQELFYTFQGTTADRAYYVAAFFPVALPGLPDSGQLSDSDFANLMADYPAYLVDTTARLDSQAPQAFTPDLSQIDRLIQSLIIQGSQP